MLRSLRRRLKKLAALQRRAQVMQARLDQRSWVVARRERTHHLIELGGLLQKSGLIELTADDRATILGGLLMLRDSLSQDDRSATLELWRRRGKRAFEEDAEAEAVSL